MLVQDISLLARQRKMSSINRFWPGILVMGFSICITWLIRNWFPFQLLFWISDGWVYMRWVIGACYLAWVTGLSSYVIADEQKVSVKNVGLTTLGFLTATASMHFFGGKVSWIWITICAVLQIVPFALNEKAWEDRTQLLVHITNFVLIAAGWLIIAGTGW